VSLIPVEKDPKKQTAVSLSAQCCAPTHGVSNMMPIWGNFDHCLVKILTIFVKIHLLLQRVLHRGSKLLVKFSNFFGNHIYKITAVNLGANLFNLFQFGLLYGRLVDFFRVGKLYQVKSGNPDGNH
jgi:hypothetical protein